MVLPLKKAGETRFRDVLCDLAARLPRPLIRLLLPKRIVLYGHLVADGKANPAATRYRYPTCAEFESFRDLVQRIGYRFVSLPEYLEGKSERCILLTFDDGFKELRDFLSRYSLPFAVFVVGETVTTGQSALSVFPARLDVFLTLDELRTMRVHGVHIGYHTMTHKLIQNEGDLIEEIAPPSELTDILSRPLSFAYPFVGPAGSQKIDARIREQGFEVIFDTRVAGRPSSVFHGADATCHLHGRIPRIPMDKPVASTSKSPILSNVIRSRLSSWLGVLKGSRW